LLQLNRCVGAVHPAFEPLRRYVCRMRGHFAQRAQTPTQLLHRFI
jgi:hypothetical protein